ncbi:MAG: HAD family hydrolase [Nitrosomonadaceae bacterium]|nr:HAD family hydrolase [Nitrosomonadaceae bacterium]|tara:strand:- start:455 stop:1111 length:657 start_codon:yes stop_codon:yes gene_type:complete
MKRKIDLIVFDWDGTLINSADAIVFSIQAAASDLGIPQPSNMKARYVIGLGLQEALDHLFPGLSSQESSKLSERYRYHYLKQDKEISLYKGVPEIIRTLYKKNLMLAVATGKSRAGLNRAFKSTGLGGFFHASRCADETLSKPNPAMLLELMSQFNVKASRTLMIGDTTHDLLMAINAGVSRVGVTYGAHSKKDLEILNPLTCIKSVKKLDLWLNKNI